MLRVFGREDAGEGSPHGLAERLEEGYDSCWACEGEVLDGRAVFDSSCVQPSGIARDS